jgi:hypothetical protein
MRRIELSIALLCLAVSFLLPAAATAQDAAPQTESQAGPVSPKERAGDTTPGNSSGGDKGLPSDRSKAAEDKPPQASEPSQASPTPREAPRQPRGSGLLHRLNSLLEEWRSSPLLVFCVGVLLGWIIILGLGPWLRPTGGTGSGEREVAEALEKPGISLATAAQEIRARQGNFVAKYNELYNSILTLQTENAALQQKLRSVELNPDQIRVAAAIASIEDATRALASATVDPDFSNLDQTFGLRNELEKTREYLAELLSGADFTKRLLDGLQRGHFDHILTTPSFLETYFAGRPRWHALTLGYRSAEALLLGLLQANGVEIVRMPLLSIIDASEARAAQVADRRNVKNIPAVRQTAARAARELEQSEFLVVDWHAPGWQSNHQIGSRAPAFALFEPASWT